MTLIGLLDEINEHYKDADFKKKATIIKILEEALLKIIENEDQNTEDIIKDNLALDKIKPILLAYRLYLDSVNNLKKN